MSNQRMPGPERQAQLLGVAREVFSLDGYHLTSMNDIAATAGVTKPVLYQHFDSKRDLYAAVLDDVGQRLQAAIIGAAAKESTPRGQVEAGIKAYVRYATEDPDGFHLLFSGISRDDSQWGQSAFAVESSMAGAVAELIVVEGMSPQLQRALANGVVGTAESMMRYWRSQGEALDRDELTKNLTSLVWGGLRGLS